MEKSMKKKAFTLVELLVVIAILAVLASVSIVGYLGFTERAKQSNDETLVAQLNTLLVGYETVEGKPETMTEVVDLFEDNGFLIEKLTPTNSKNEFVWDSEKNEFVIIKDDELATNANAKSWAIVNDETNLNNLTDKYSLYLGKNFEESGDKTLTVKNGLDMGKYLEPLEINYNGGAEAKTTTFCTTAGKLNIDAELDTVKHFGTIDDVVVTKVSTHSYHENGAVKGSLSFAKGHLVVNASAKVENLMITAAQSSDISLTVAQSAKVETLTETTAGVIAGSTSTLPDGLEKTELHLVTNDEDLDKMALEGASGVYRLQNDIEMDGRLDITTKVSLDLNGYTISMIDTIPEPFKPGTETLDKLGEGNTYFRLSDGADLTIYGNGKIIYAYGDGDNNSLGMNFILSGNAKLTIENGYHKSGLTTVQIQDTTECTINGGYYEADFGYSNRMWILNKIDRSKDTAKFSVTGGTFVKYNPLNSDTETPKDNFVAEGYTVKTTSNGTDNVYTVVKA